MTVPDAAVDEEDDPAIAINCSRGDADADKANDIKAFKNKQLRVYVLDPCGTYHCHILHKIH